MRQSFRNDFKLIENVESSKEKKHKYITLVSSAKVKILRKIFLISDRSLLMKLLKTGYTFEPSTFFFFFCLFNKLGQIIG